MTYAPVAARALKTVTRKGAAVSFTLTTPGTYDATTDTWTTPATSTITGSAVEDGASPDTYERLSLVQSQAPTLFFTPTVYGQMPTPGYAVVWNSIAYTVRDVLAVSPDGRAICATIVVSK